MLNFFFCFQSEWLKKKHSLASWLVILGGFFIPAILLISHFVYSDNYLKSGTSGHFWVSLWNTSWNSMAVFLLPLGVVLVVSLITQLEYKNNTWKQVHTTPQRLTTIYFAKLAIILVMMVQFFILFTIGIYLSGIIPGLVLKAGSYPQEPIAYAVFMKQGIRYFIDCLPIIALQYLFGLQFKNFMVSLAAGIGLWIVSMVVLINAWKYSYIVPYIYGSLNFFRGIGKFNQPIHIHFLALGYFILFIVAGYFLYITKKAKG